MVAVPHADGDRPRGGVDPRRARDHGGQLGHRRAHPTGDAGAVLHRGGARRLRVPRGRGRRRAVLRPPVRQARAPQPLHDHPGRVPGGQRPHRAHARQRPVLDRLPLPHPLHRGHGHRRRVRRDQLGHRRAHPVALPGPRRHHGQRHLLGGRDPRHPRQPDLPQRPEPLGGLARCLPHRPGARPRHPVRAPPPSGEPPVAGDERPRAPGRGVDLLHRARGRAVRGHTCRRSTRARRWTCSPPRRSATWRSPGCSSATTRPARCSARR